MRAHGRLWPALVVVARDGADARRRSSTPLLDGPRSRGDLFRGLGGTADTLEGDGNVVDPY
nr:hypothetical protein [Myxococcales bacterium]